MKTKVLAVIPSRYSSRRFPGKALAQIDGKSLLERLYREVAKAKLVDKVVVATDAPQIYDEARRFGGEVIMTSGKHHTGSDRSAEAAEKLGGQIIVSVQADHLGVKSVDYDRVISNMLGDRKIAYATLASKIDSEDKLFDPNRVKLLIDNHDHAIWFSRYPIPFMQGVDGDRLAQMDFYYHIGVYFFRRSALAEFHSWKQSRYEKAESLEQLRILENGGQIRVFKIHGKVLSIDTPDDLCRVKKVGV